MVATVKKVKVEKVELVTTLGLIEQHSPCVVGLLTLIESLPESHKQDDPINLLHILKSNGVVDFFWALRAVKVLNKSQKRAIQLILADIVERVEPLFRKKFPGDPRVLNVIHALRSTRRLENSLVADANGAINDAVNAGCKACCRAANAAYCAVRAAHAYNADYNTIHGSRFASSTSTYARYAAGRVERSKIIKKYLK